MNDFPETPKTTNAGALGANASHGADASLGSNASHGTAEAAAMREAEMWRRERRDRRKISEGNALSVSSGGLDSAQTIAILSLAARLDRLEAAGTGYSMLLQGGGGGASKLQLVDASSGGTLKVGVTVGTVSHDVPTMAGSPLTATPAPTLTITQSGFVVLVTTWTDDHVPRSRPLTRAFVFEAGNPDADYVPPSADTRTSSRMAHGRVWVTDGKIVRLETGPSGSLVVVRTPFTADYVEFTAYRI